MKEYRYEPLDPNINAFRLLAILPSWRRASCLRCELFHADLDDLSSTGCTFYEALSYTWGDAAQKVEIELDEKRFTITKNLALALHKFRAHKPQQDSITVIWVDSICINQDDLGERREQVQKMKQIYERAAQVLVWLGPDAEDSARAMDVIEYMTDADTPDDWMIESMQDPAQLETWQAMARLFARPFWRRVWIRQEIAVAKEIMVMCGSRKEKWPTLVLACEMLYKERDVFAQIVLGVSEYSSGFHQVLFIETMREDLAEGRPISFQHMLFHNRACESTDPRDRVFAVLGLVGDTTPAPPGVHPDYLLSKQEVYITAVCAQMAQSKSLDILSGCQYSAQETELPSWVPDFETDWKADLFRAREEGENIYTAGGEVPATFNVVYENGKYILTAQDIAWDVVVDVGLECNALTVHESMTSWKKLVQKTFGPCSSLAPGTVEFNVFWRTLIADQDIFGDRAKFDTVPGPGHRSYQPGSKQIKQSIPDLITDVWYTNEKFSIFSDRFDEVAIHRSLFATSRGHLGIGSGMLPGDVVCILFGANLPILLRRCQDSYVVICEACKLQLFYPTIPRV